MEDQAIVVNKGEELMDLPPGFRFHPTDEEIITHYLTEKVINSNFCASAVGEADFNKSEPWDLPKKAKMGEKEWYFFCQRDRKYPTGMRTNRATESGYWKATGKDKEIYRGKRGSQLVGMKKTLVFYRGRAPKGEKTGWVMHEYRLEGKFSYCNLPNTAKDEWVVCRVFHKNTGMKKTPISPIQGLLMRMNDEQHQYPPPLYGYDDEQQQQSSAYTRTVASTSNNNNYLNYFSINGSNANQQQPSSSSKSPFPILYSQLLPNIPNSSSISSYDHNGFMEMKVEPFSSNNHSLDMLSLSQDTGLTADVNTTAEISSLHQPPPTISDLQGFDWDDF